MNQPKQATPFDPTIDAMPSAASMAPNPHHAVALVEGSTPELSAETNDLLRERLRLASLLLFSGFLAFFVRKLFSLGRIETTFDWVLFADHAAMMVITGLIGVRLCTECPTIRRHLRLAEVMVFGGSALFFLLISCAMLVETARSAGVARLLTEDMQAARV